MFFFPVNSHLCSHFFLPEGKVWTRQCPSNFLDLKILYPPSLQELHTPNDSISPSDRVAISLSEVWYDKTRDDWPLSRHSLGLTGTRTNWRDPVCNYFFHLVIVATDSEDGQIIKRKQRKLQLLQLLAACRCNVDAIRRNTVTTCMQWSKLHDMISRRDNNATENK